MFRPRKRPAEVAPRKVVPITFAVVGAPRSGTNYVHKVLSLLGLTCGHEVWLEQGDGWAPYREEPGIWGTVSYNAVPQLVGLPPTTLAVHNLRHPLRVITTMAAIKPPVAWKKWVDLVGRPDQGDEPAQVAEWFWWRWNDLALRSGRINLRWRVDSPKEFGRKLRQFLELIGKESLVSKVDKVLGNVPRNVNTRTERLRPTGTKTVMGWDDLQTRTRMLAEHFGYGPELEPIGHGLM